MMAGIRCLLITGFNAHLITNLPANPPASYHPAGMKLLQCRPNIDRPVSKERGNYKAEMLAAKSSSLLR
jgi:hypothetical protein